MHTGNDRSILNNLWNKDNLKSQKIDGEGCPNGGEQGMEREAPSFTVTIRTGRGGKCSSTEITHYLFIFSDNDLLSQTCPPFLLLTICANSLIYWHPLFGWISPHSESSHLVSPLPFPLPIPTVISSLDPFWSTKWPPLSADPPLSLKLRSQGHFNAVRSSLFFTSSFHLIASHARAKREEIDHHKRPTADSSYQMTIVVEGKSFREHTSYFYSSQKTTKELNIFTAFWGFQLLFHLHSFI